MSLRMRRVTWALLGASWLVSSCECFDPKTETARVSFEDGVYLVVAPAGTGTAGGAMAAAHGIVELETLPLKDEPVETIRVSMPPVVRFREMQLRGIHFDEKKACELITFENDERLKAFSRGHVGSRVAMVIAGKVVSYHKVRVPLESDEVQISFCTEGLGDHLHKHLRQVYSYIPEKYRSSSKETAPSGDPPTPDG